MKNTIEIITHSEKQFKITLQKLADFKEVVFYIKDSKELTGVNIKNKGNIEIKYFKFENVDSYLITFEAKSFYDKIKRFLSNIKIVEKVEGQPNFIVDEDKNVFIENINEKELTIIKKYLNSLKIYNLNERPFYERS